MEEGTARIINMAEDMVGPSSPPPMLRSSEVAVDTPLRSPHAEAFPDLTEEELTERLRKAVSERRVSQKRNLLQAIQRGEDIEIPPELLRDEDGGSKRQRSEGWGRIQLPQPRYKGRSFAELRTFFTDVETYFQTQRGTFDTEAKKVFFATACLEGDIKQRWTSYLEREKQGKQDQLTWQELRTWVTDQIKDPITDRKSVV